MLCECLFFACRFSSEQSFTENVKASRSISAGCCFRSIFIRVCMCAIFGGCGCVNGMAVVAGIVFVVVVVFVILTFLCLNRAD